MVGGYEKAHVWSSYCFKSSPSCFCNSTNKLIHVLNILFAWQDYVYLLPTAPGKKLHLWPNPTRTGEMTGHCPRLGGSSFCKWSESEDSVQTQVQWGWLQHWEGAQRDWSKRVTSSGQTHRAQLDSALSLICPTSVHLQQSEPASNLFF